MSRRRLIHATVSIRPFSGSVRASIRCLVQLSRDFGDGTLAVDRGLQFARHRFTQEGQCLQDRTDTILNTYRPCRQDRVWSQLIPRASPVEGVPPNATGWGTPCRKFVSISDSASSGRIVDPWRSMGLFDTFTSWKTHADLTNGGHQEEFTCPVRTSTVKLTMKTLVFCCVNDYT